MCPASLGATSPGHVPRPPGLASRGRALASEHPPRRPSQEPRGPRSPAVLGAVVASVEHFFETVGVSLAERQVCLPLFSVLFRDFSYMPACNRRFLPS